MYREDLGIYLSIISSSRPGNVKKMQDLIGKATWYVATGQGEVYEKEGALVIESGPLCRSRNAGLQDAWKKGVPVLQLSDDLKSLARPVYNSSKGKYVAQSLSFPEAVASMMIATMESGAKLSGVAPTSNPYFYRGEKVSEASFIVGDMIYVEPCGLLFDENLTLKEDYDYTIRHLNKYGKVARCNDILATFLHRENKGGACEIRTSKLEKENIQALRRKWGSDIIRDNPRRKDEILLNLRKYKKPKFS